MFFSVGNLNDQVTSFYTFDADLFDHLGQAHFLISALLLLFCHKKQENRYMVSVISYQQKHIYTNLSSILPNPQISK